MSVFRYALQFFYFFIKLSIYIYPILLYIFIFDCHFKHYWIKYLYADNMMYFVNLREWFVCHYLTTSSSSLTLLGLHNASKYTHSGYEHILIFIQSHLNPAGILVINLFYVTVAYVADRNFHKIIRIYTTRNNLMSSFVGHHEHFSFQSHLYIYVHIHTCHPHNHLSVNSSQLLLFVYHNPTLNNCISYLILS